MAEWPSGTVTFLFTDIEGSSRLWEQHSGAMNGALARHDEILRTAIEDNHGHVVKTTGDGFHAAFATAEHAVLAALTGQLELGREPWELPAPLLVRMGVHTGPAEQRDGDYYGPTVNRAARLMSVAHGGQIVVSLATEELARERVGHEPGLLDLGEHHLRDVGRPERVFQVTHPDLRPTFPPLNSLAAGRGNLPSQLSSFVGREAERAAVAKAIGEARLVTLTGVGGVGKTRLALEVAMLAQPDFGDGAWFCELAAASDQAALEQVVARALGAAPRPGLTLAQSIIEFLRGRHTFIVFDNCEHLIDEVGHLAESILRECAGVRILATSREGLAVAGERVWPLRSLPVPDADSALAAAAESASVRLFVDRAHAARPGFVLDAGNAAAIADVCRRLDGIPLAIELAAARVVVMNPSEISARLDERFRLLTGGRRSGVERHQTLRGAVDWSYSLLSDTEALVFDRLGVFAGEFDLAAATEVTAGEGVEAWDVVDAVGSLVAKSMLTSDDATEGTTRFRLLETMRQYACDRLEERGDSDARRRRHARYHATRAEEAGRGLRGPDELFWRACLAFDLDNIRAAVTWSLDADDAADHECGLRIVAAFAGEASTGAQTFGGGLWAERALAAARAGTKLGLRADVVAAAGWSVLLRGDTEAARACALEALELGVLPDMWAPSSPFVLLGYLEVVGGRLDAAVACTAEGRDAIAALPGDHLYELATIWLSHAAFLTFGSERDQALHDGAQVLRMARELANPSVLSNALTVTVVSTWVDEPAVAAPLLDEALDLVRRGANGVMFGIMLAIRAQLHLHDGDVTAARGAVREAVAYLSDTGDLPQLVTVFGYCIPVLDASGSWAAAAVLAGFVLDGPLAPLGSMPADVLPLRDGAIERARRELGDERFDIARAHGATRSPEEAVAHVLDALEEPPAPAH